MLMEDTPDEFCLTMPGLLRDDEDFGKDLCSLTQIGVIYGIILGSNALIHLAINNWIRVCESVGVHKAPTVILRFVTLPLIRMHQ